ncbi:MAG: ribosomal protein S18-alanine N-acetyltransferase [Sphingomicrobium sp.]
MTQTQSHHHLLSLHSGTSGDLQAVMQVMNKAFHPSFGEAWTYSQCAGILPMTGVELIIATEDARQLVGFALYRTVADEAELLLLAVDPAVGRQGIGTKLLDRFIADASGHGASRLHLEVRENNPAIALYRNAGFAIAGRRAGYYSGAHGETFDALTLARPA